MNPQRSSSTILKLEPNVPTELALHTASSLNVSGQYGPQTLFTLTGNRRLYVPTHVGEEINALTLAPGQPFVICKRSRAAGRGFDWTVERKPVQAVSTPQNAPNRPHPPLQIESALKTAIQAAHSAERFAAEIGYTVRFTSEDLRAMANTILIGMQRVA